MSSSVHSSLVGQTSLARKKIAPNKSERVRKEKKGKAQCKKSKNKLFIHKYIYHIIQSKNVTKEKKEKEKKREEISHAKVKVSIRIHGSPAAEDQYIQTYIYIYGTYMTLAPS